MIPVCDSFADWKKTWFYFIFDVVTTYISDEIIKPFIYEMVSFQSLIDKKLRCHGDKICLRSCLVNSTRDKTTGLGKSSLSDKSAREVRIST